VIGLKDGMNKLPDREYQIPEFPIELTASLIAVSWFLVAGHWSLHTSLRSVFLSPQLRLPQLRNPPLVNHLAEALLVVEPEDNLVPRFNLRSRF